jgi:hypothetical protein
MPSIRVSGILDEGINSRDSERLLSSSLSNQRKQIQQSRQRRVDTNRPPVTQLTHQQQQPVRSSYERVPSNSRHQTQTQRYSLNHDTCASAQHHLPVTALNNQSVQTHPNHRHPKNGTNTMHPMQYQPLVTTKSHHEQSMTSSNLDDSDNLREFIIEKTASSSTSSSKNEDYNILGCRHQSPLPQSQYYSNTANQAPTRHSTIMDGPNQRFKSTDMLSTYSKTDYIDSTSSSTIPIEFEQEHDEFDNEEEDYCNCCCNLHSASSSSSQPLCNEGTKNLCTLAIWAIIILIIVNRFLAHMSMFLHRHGAAVAASAGSVEVKSVP